MRSIASILGLIYFASELLLSVTRRSPKSANVREEDHSSLRALWLVIMASIAAAIWFALHVRVGLLAHPRAFAHAGVVIFALGLILRWWAIIQLGRFFTVNVAIVHDHRLVEAGPYRFVRHPSYTGVLVAFLGFGLSLGNWLALLILLVPIFAVFVYRMNVEERALTNALGESYLAYTRRTKRLLPFVY